MTQEGKALTSKILKSAAKDIRFLKTAIECKSEESIISEVRGFIKGKLAAATMLTGNEYTWDTDGIYENHGNEPIFKA